MLGCSVGVSHFPWLHGGGATSFSFEEVGPSHVFEATFDGEQCIGADFRPAASRLFESAADDALAGVFHRAGSDRPKARLECLHGPAVPLHPLAATRAGPRRKSGISCLQQIRAGLRFEAERQLAGRRLNHVQILNPANPELRLQPRKRPAELRLDCRMQRVHLKGPNAEHRTRRPSQTRDSALGRPRAFAA